MRAIIKSGLVRTGLAAAAIAVLGAASASASTLIVLGDSTADAGSAFIASGGTSASAEEGYFQGRFTNGPNAADYVRRALFGDLTTSYLAGGDNFAFGGAAIVTDVNQGPGGLPPGIPDLADQIATFLARGPVDPAAPVFVSFAGNDFLAVRAGAIEGETVAALALEQMEAQLGLLAEAGAGTVAVSNVASAGFLLGGDADLAATVDAYNVSLAALLVELSQTTTTNFVLADRDGVYDRIFADPLAFGFDPALLGTPCIADPAAVPTCDGYLFFDTVHTTSQAQAFVADAVLGALEADVVPLPAAAWIFISGALGLAGLRRAAS